MNNNSGYDESCMDDGAWDSLFKMAENAEYESDFEGQAASEYDMPVYDNVAFQENEPGENRSYGTPEEALKALFGYAAFRPGQKEVIDNILSGRDVFAVMPTGAGKSVCYQIPAMLLPGITIVISPLISLMQDQVKALNEAGIPAAFINSSLSENMFYETVNRARQGVYKIIYVAPERLVTDSFLELAQNIRISMLTVDEAHCISQWGQDFRPSYMKIVEFVRLLDRRPVISAFTATATENVRVDIVCTLGLVNPYTLVTGFDRENLFFQVEKPKKKEQYILDYIAEHEGDSGIIYCATRKNVDNLYDLLKSRGISAVKYHAGMSAEERKRMQDAFVFDYISIVVATNAFGMGIDKSNVRFVIHYNMPKNMESYYQEAGRAGRDGEPADCLLLYGGRDVVTNQMFIDNNRDNEELDDVTRAIVAERDRDRLKKMTFYCFTNDCLREYILRYFGEYGSGYCGNCSNCKTQFEEMDVTEIAKAIVGCVAECRERYGTTVILDTVHGAATVKIRNYHMDENSHYGELSKVPTYRLRQVLNFLQVKEYLVVTSDEYAIVKLGKNAAPLLNGEDEKVMMKLPKEQERMKTGKTSSAKKPKMTAGSENFTEEETTLFDLLKELRREIAKEEKVPPYIVFSDKTLVHMCLIKPKNKGEMLKVSGVGEFKFEKYGERFLDKIRDSLSGEL